MFTDVIAESSGLTDGEIDASLRANELELREVMARRAVLVTLAHRRGVFRIDGHRSVNAYLRATWNYSSAEAARIVKLAEVCELVPELGDALLEGHVGVGQIMTIASIHSNPRVREHFTRVAPIFLAMAEHAPPRELYDEVASFVNLADQDGAYADLYCNVEARRATCTTVDGTLHVTASGGDPIVAEEVVATFDWFVEREFERDCEQRRAEFGDAADQQPLPRTDRQRRFDALVAMARAARAHGDGAKPADIVVNLVGDPETFDEAFAAAEVVLDDDGGLTTIELSDDAVDGVLATAAADPERFIDRRCETSSGTPIPPMLLLRAALEGHVRRVVIDSRSVVIDWGRKRRLFTGPAREAALLLVRRCEHPGCEVAATYADVDHMVEWHDDGGTDQDNGGVLDRSHNRFKHRARWRIRRDGTGRKFFVRADGTIVLPVGAREPELVDECDEAIDAAA